MATTIGKRLTNRNTCFPRPPQDRRAARLKNAGRLAILTVALAALAPAAARAGTADSYLQSAHQLEKAHDLRGAEIQLRNAAQAEAGNGAIRLELAEVYLELGDANAAQAELFAAHLRGIKEAATAPLMAQALLKTGEFGDLLKTVPAGNRPAKAESLVRAYRGMAELALNETDHARAMFADAERLDPKSPLPLIGEARLLMAQHQLDAAAQRLDRALKLEPDNGDALDARALILAMRGQAGAAMQQFAAALHSNPRNIRALLDRTNLEVQLGNLDSADKDVKTLQSVTPGNGMVIYLQALIDTRRGKYREADLLLGRLSGAMANIPAAYLVAAEVKFRLNQLGMAQSFVDKFIAQAGEQPNADELLGAIALKRGDAVRAIGAFEKAVRLAPNDANALGMLGQAYLAHGDLAKAKAAFDLASQKAPSNAPLATERALTDFANGDRGASLATLGGLFKGGKGSVMAGPPLVVAALQSGRLDDAAAAAQQLVTRDPKNPTYQELLAAVRIAQRNYPAAEALLRGVLATRPDLVSARRDLAQVYLSTNRMADAKKLYQDRLRARPGDSDSLEALADIAFRQKDDNGAISLLAQAQKALPSDPGPSLRIVAIYEARKKWPDAIAATRALHTKFPNAVSVEDTLAHLCFESGDHAASLGIYRDAATKFPNVADIFAHYSAVYAADKNYAAAAPLALRAVQLDPQSADLKSAFLSLTYLARGADAVLPASQLVLPDKTAAAVAAADALDGNGNRPAAIAMLEKSQVQNPASPIVVRLASLYQRDNRLDKAVTLLEPWTAAHPMDADARFLFAQLDSATGKLKAALAQYEWLATQKPDNVVILNNLAWLYDWEHDPRARGVAEKAIRLAPGSGSVADTLGWILVEQGDAAGAAKYLAQASASQPSDGAIQYHYAVVLSKTGKADQARDVLQKLLKLNAEPETKSKAQLLLAKLGGGR